MSLFLHSGALRHGRASHMNLPSRFRAVASGGIPWRVAGRTPRDPGEQLRGWATVNEIRLNISALLREAMNGADLEKLRVQMGSAQSVAHEKVENVLHSCAELPRTDRRTLAFYLTRCDADGFREDELIDFLLNQIV